MGVLAENHERQLNTEDAAGAEHREPASALAGDHAPQTFKSKDQKNFGPLIFSQISVRCSFS